MVTLFGAVRRRGRRHNNSKSNSYWFLSIVLYSLILTFLFISVGSTNDDLYKILGVKRSSTTKEIKSAYRQKARDTHPDKNPNVDPEEAAANFHKVVEAFEVLSDEQSRRRYDQTGRHHDSNGNMNNNGGGFHNSGGGFSFQFRNGRFYYGRNQQQQSMKDKFEVQQAQSRVMHVVSLAQLETVMLDDNDRVEKSLLICFVTPGVEKIADDTILFPYPFAGMSPQHIWWEDILQTVKVRYHRSNDIQEKFNINHGDSLKEPTFVFVKRGDPLEHYKVKTTSSRNEFDTWVWSMLEVPIQFKNNHSHAVEIYWINGNRAMKKGVIQPNEIFTQHTRLSHEWYVRDERVDSINKNRRWNTRLTTNSSLGSWKILNDLDLKEPILITTKCFDMSGECPYWSVTPRPGECHRNPNFMLTNCKKTCGACDNDNDEEEKIDDHHDEL